MSSVVRVVDLLAIGLIYLPPLCWLTAQIYSFFFSSEEVTRAPQKYRELLEEVGGFGSFLWVAQRRHRIIRFWLMACIPALIWYLAIGPRLID